MNVNEKKNLIKAMYEKYHESILWMDKIHSNTELQSIVDAICDNPLVNNQYAVIDIMIDAIFGDKAEAVYWVLYEWKRGYEVTYPDGKTEKIYTIEQAIDSVFWDDEPAT
jgi:hypothetical protein